jgi:secondary thiamine-phosphate synthase enzyme
MVHTVRHRIATAGQRDAHDITRHVSAAVAASTLKTGIAAVFVIGSTAVLTTIEFEPGAIADLNDLLEQIAPRQAASAHHQRWGDDNGSSHVRAALMGPSLTVPFVAGELVLGTWQQIMLLECDTRARTREVVIQIVGE